MRTMLAMPLCLVLTGCVTTSSNYARTDGRLVDQTQARSTLAQCQGEGAQSVLDFGVGGGLVGFTAGQITRSQKETAVTNACMARNGYITTQ